MRLISHNIRLNLILLLIFFCIPFSLMASPILKDFEGQFHTLDEYKVKDKWLVVMLWASDCQVCNQEAHQYVKFHAEHAKKDAAILGISLDGDAKKADGQAFMQKHKINFPSLIGEPESIALLYQELTDNEWVGTPTFLVYGPDGELRGQQVGAVPTETIESFIARESASAPEATTTTK